MDKPSISYSARPDTTAESELSALANVYRLLLDSAKKRGRLLDKSGPDDAKERSENDSSARTIIPDR